MLRKISQMIKCKKKSGDQIYSIGNLDILIPSSHKLPEYQKSYQNYDKKIRNIITSIERIKGVNTIIDIGANIGDTAVFIRSFSNAKIICIEGDNLSLDYLKKNTHNLSDIVICPVYVQGRDADEAYEIQRHGGTARLEKSSKDENLEFMSLVDIMKINDIQPDSLELLKIDTDGFDFEILLDNSKLIDNFRPDIYFEYDITPKEQFDIDSIKVIELLQSFGYSFIVYDNFGNLLNIVEDDCKQRFLHLNHYLKSCKKYGGGIYYFDIFATVNKEIIQDIWRNDDI